MSLGLQYHLPACLRFLEASHTVEILRAAGPHGMHVRELSRHVGVDEGKLSERVRAYDRICVADGARLGHILRLLATHHITRELQPNVFANNRISAIMDSGRAWEELRKAYAYSPSPSLRATTLISGAAFRPQDKYEATNGIAAFVNLWHVSPSYTPLHIGAFKLTSVGFGHEQHG